MTDSYCEICDLSFANKSQLAAHKRTVFHKQKLEANQSVQIQANDSKDEMHSNVNVSNGNAPAYFCSLCDAQCSNEQLYIAHLNGSKHQKKINQTRYEELKKAKDPSVYCEACDIILDPVFMQMHLEGNKHLTKIGMGKPSKRKADNSMEISDSIPSKKYAAAAANVMAPQGGDTAVVKKVLPYMEGSLRVQLTAPNNLVCLVCNHAMHDLLTVNDHLNSRQHMRRYSEVVVNQVRPSLTAINKKDSPKDSPFYCAVCKVGCTDEGVYNLHLNGFKHVYKSCGGQIDPHSPFAARAQKLKEHVLKFREMRRLKAAAKAEMQAL